MVDLALGTILFIVALGAFLIGIRVREMLPRRYSDDWTTESLKQAVRQTAILATMVLGFVTASAKSNYDAKAELVAESAMRFVTLDRILAGIGPRVATLREELKRILEGQVNWMRSTSEVNESAAAIIERVEEYEAFHRRLVSIEPESDLEAGELRRARELVADLLRYRWMFRLDHVARFPFAFMFFVLVWIGFDFFYGGLISSNNYLVILTAIFAAFSVASATFLMLELEGPTSGLIRISPEPLEKALSVFGR